MIVICDQIDLCNVGYLCYVSLKDTHLPIVSHKLNKQIVIKII